MIMSDFNEAKCGFIMFLDVKINPLLKVGSFLDLINLLGQLLQMHGSNLTPFCKQLLFDIHNLEMKLHLLVKRSCQKGYYKGLK